MDYKRIRLKEEQLMYNRIFEKIQATHILELMKVGRIEDKELINYRKIMNGILVKVTRDLTPDLYKIFRNVIKRLEYTKPIECYIANDPNANAFNYSLNFFNQPDVIIITSKLINTYDEDEIKFSIGHEIGHLIIDEKNLGLVRNFLFYDNENTRIKDKYLSLLNEMKYLDNLVELSADRFGLIACENLNSALSAIFKMYSGIDIKKKFSFSKIFENSNKELTDNLTSISLDIIKNKGASTSFLNNDHPIYPIRILSIKYFESSKLFKNYNSKNIIEDKKLQKNINKLCDKLKDFENSNDLIPFFITSAGLIIAELDGEITIPEIENIEYFLSQYTLFPTNLIEYIFKSGNIKEIFEKSTKTLLVENPEIRNAMFNIMIKFALSDGILDDKEKEFLFRVGKDIFNLSKEDIAYNIAFSFRDMYYYDNLFG